MDTSIQSIGTYGASNTSNSTAMSPTQRFTNMFNQIDASGSGSITEDQFDTALQAMNPQGASATTGSSSSSTADALWKQLDPNGTGSVSKQDFVSGMTTAMKQMRGAHHHHHGGGSSVSGAQQTAQGASSVTGQSSTQYSSNGTSTATGIGSLLNAEA